MVLLDRQTDSAAKRQRLTYIDAARGMAVLMVAVQHTLEKIVLAAGPSAFGRGLNDLIGYYFNFGRFGVVLFFFISGFVVPNSFPNTQKPIRDFAVNRLLRLYPMYWLSILFCVTIVPLYTGVAFPLHQVLINITMFQAFFGVDGLNVFYWTLAVELMFYIICAALFGMGMLQRGRTAVMIAILGSIGGALALLFLTLPGTARLVELTLNFMAMFLGKAIRDHFRERRVGGGLLCVGIAAYTVFALTVSLLKYGGPYVPSTFFSSTAMATSYIGAMALFLVLNAFPDRFDWPRLAAVGVISYSIYLIHPFVLDIYVHSVGVGSTALQWGLVLVVTLSSSAALSVVTYNLLERSCILLGRRLRSDRVAPAPDRADRVPV